MKRCAVLLVLLAVACAAPQASVPPPDSRAPDIRGSVTRATASEIRVEEIPHESRGAKAVVKISGDTAIRHRSGRRMAASEIRQGQTVSVWFDGAVAQSYPLQASASEIVVE